MNEIAIGIIGIIFLVSLILFRINIAFAMALIGFLGFAFIGGLGAALSKLSLIPYHTVSDYSLAVLPLFLLMGVLASKARISDDLYAGAHKWIGAFRGGLSIATVLACAGFSAICGSSSACAAAMGKVAVPSMKKYKYDDRLSAGCIAAGGTLGILIPPSLGFILYAMLTEESVGKLFIAGIIPGISACIFYLFTIYLICRFKPDYGPPGPKFTFKEKIVASKAVFPMIFLFILVIGGIYGGFFTPSEAAAIGAFGTLILGLVLRRLNFIKFQESFLEAIKTTAMIIVLFIGATIFMNFLAVTNISFIFADFLAGLSVNRYLILAAILVFYIIIGCFMDILSSMVLTLPILFPAITSLGFDPIWFGVIMVRCMEIGMITPPVGLSCYILSGATGVPVNTIFRGIIPFVIGDIFHILLLVMIPSLCLYLPNLMN